MFRRIGLFQRVRRDFRPLLVAVTASVFLAAAPSVASSIARYARNAGKVDGFEANELARASSAIASGHISNFSSRGWANIQQTRVVAPAKGVLLLWAGSSAEWDDDSEPGSYATLIARLTVDRRSAGSPQRVEISRATRAGTQHLSLSAAIPVRAGSHRIAFQLRSAAGEALTYVYPRHVETLFVPFGNRGAQGRL